MALSLKDLKAVMAPLTQLGKGEDHFEVDGLTITVRTLSPGEEVAIQRYARGALTEGDANDQINALDYLDRFRLACLGYAIVQIGDLDFRDTSTVETGDTLPSGVAVKIKKHEAIMQVMGEWTRPMVVAVFNRFTSLTEKVETAIDKSIKFDDDHIDAEIARLEERLGELKATKVKKAAADSDPREDTLAAASNKPLPSAANKTEPGPTQVTWETARMNRTSEDAALSVASPESIPKSVVVEEGVQEERAAAVPPTSSVASETPPAPTEAPSAGPSRRPLFGERPPVRAPQTRELPASFDEVETSLVDTSDQSVIAAETARLLALRAQRVPPHLAARDVAKATQTGNIEGVPVFKMPVEHLTPETVRTPGRMPPPVTRSNVNPHFRPAK